MFKLILKTPIRKTIHSEKIPTTQPKTRHEHNKQHTNFVI